MIDRTHGGNIYKYLKNHNLSKRELIDFSANINPFGLSSRTKEVILRNLDCLTHYPDPECNLLKEKLASFHNIKPHNLLVGNGSIELIYLIPKALSSKNVLMPIPSFTEYEFAARTNGAKIIFVRSSEKDGFKIEIEKLKRFIPRVDLVFICNPNNPTGSLLSKEGLLYLIGLCRKNRTIMVIDEVFIDFVKDAKGTTLIIEAAKERSTLILRSLTKIFALPGLRLGYLVGHRDLVNRLSKFQYPWSVNAFAQLVGEAVIEDKLYVKKSREFVFRERDFLFDNLKRMKGLFAYPANANFIFCKLLSRKVSSSKKLSEELAKRGIMIRDCSNFRGLDNNFFRLAVRRRDENIRLLFALKEVLG
jgi:threonine-phosphate decarboxylase